jgi:hypothetical protein
MIEMIESAVNDAGANILVGAIVLMAFAMALGAVLFGLLAVRGMWRWLTRHSWSDVVASTGRKALR